MSKTMTLHVRYTFWYISFPSSAKQQREMTSFKFFWRTGTHEGEFFFSYWTWAPSLRIQFPDSSKAHRMKMNNISSKPEMAEVSACADVLPRCRGDHWVKLYLHFLVIFEAILNLACIPCVDREGLGRKKWRNWGQHRRTTAQLTMMGRIKI